MRKLFLSLAIIAGSLTFFSCADDLDAQEINPVNVETRNSANDIILSESQQSALNHIYNFCVQNYAKEIGEAAYIFENPTNSEKIAVIRFCDYCLDGGDTICEMWQWDEIRDFVWPDGYGKF